MRGTVFVVAILFAMNINICSAQQIPEIGETWAGEVRSREKLYVMPPYGIEDKIVFQVDNIEFSGAVKDKKIVFISTANPDFLINGKKYIGKPLSSFENRDEVVTVKGWGYYLKIDDEWYAGFDHRNSSKVSFVFKYKPPQRKI